MSEPVLKPCPFCGGKAEIEKGPFGEIQVRCVNKGCDGGLGPSCWQTDNEMAARAWNRRDESAINEARVEGMRMAKKAVENGGYYTPNTLIQLLIDEESK